MGRPPKIPVDLHTDLLKYYQAGSLDEARRWLLTLGIDCDCRTISRVIKKYDATQNVQTKDSPELRLRIAAIYFSEFFTDDEILEILRGEGYVISKTGLVRIRIDLKIFRRILVEYWDTIESEWRRIVKETLDKGQITQYGREYLYTYFHCISPSTMALTRFATLALLQFRCI